MQPAQSSSHWSRRGCGIQPQSQPFQIAAQNLQRRRSQLDELDPRRPAAERLDAHRSRAGIQIQKSRALNPRRKNIEESLAQAGRWWAGWPAPAERSSVRERSDPAITRIRASIREARQGPTHYNHVCEAGQSRWAAGWASRCASTLFSRFWRSFAWSSARRERRCARSGALPGAGVGCGGAGDGAAARGCLAGIAAARHSAPAHRRTLCLCRPGEPGELAARAAGNLPWRWPALWQTWLRRSCWPRRFWAPAETSSSSPSHGSRPPGWCAAWYGCRQDSASCTCSRLTLWTLDGCFEAALRATTDSLPPAARPPGSARLLALAAMVGGMLAAQSLAGHCRLLHHDRRAD